VICRTTVRRFDGDSSPSLHFAVFTRGATGLRFIAWTAVEKLSGRYPSNASSPVVTLAWVPTEQVSDESSSPTQINAALASPDHVPLVVERQQPAAYVSDAGQAFPVVSLKGTSMVLVGRLEQVSAGTHGQMTFGWEGGRC